MSFDKPSCRNTHYGNSMEPHKMREWGPKIAASMEAIIAEGKYPILVYRGMSGISTATTIANFMTSNHGDDYAMMYVRKKNEKSHGQRVEYTKFNVSGRELVWVFCDDFISSGRTVLEVFKAICNYFKDEIAFDSIRYALSLDERWEESYTVNDIKGALVNLYDGRNAIIKKMRRRHCDMLCKLRKEMAAQQERQRIANEEFLASLTSN